MTWWGRLIYAWFATVAALGAIMVVNAVLATVANTEFWGVMLFSPAVVLAVFVVAWVAAPKLRKWFPWSRGE